MICETRIYSNFVSLLIKILIPSYIMAKFGLNLLNLLGFVIVFWITYIICVCIIASACGTQGRVFGTALIRWLMI